MSEEEQRVKREGLTEEQAAIFDLLLKPALTTKEKNKIKEIAIDLLEVLKKDPLKVEQWSDKTSIAAEVRNVIKMYLYQNLPEPYNETEIELKTVQLYNHIKDSYWGNGRSVYA